MAATANGTRLTSRRDLTGEGRTIFWHLAFMAMVEITAVAVAVAVAVIMTVREIALLCHGSLMITGMPVPGVLVPSVTMVATGMTVSVG